MPTGSSAQASGEQQKTQLIPFLIMTALFFLWGLLTVLNDIWVPFLKEKFSLSHTQAGLIQTCFFLAYFLVSPFASKIIDLVGYQKGIITGLVITALGCFLFFPSGLVNIYSGYLVTFFVLASGITILQVAANPYVTALGSEKTSASRLNLAQSANSLGTTVGPIFGGLFIAAAAGALLTGILGAVLIIVAGLFVFAIKLPRIKSVEATPEKSRGLWKNKQLMLGAAAIFLYVGGEVAIGTWLTDYIIALNNYSLETASKFISYYWGGALIGRVIGAILMNYIKETKYLAFNSALAILMILVSINSELIYTIILLWSPYSLQGAEWFTSGNLAMVSMLSVGLFNSIMFPTIFALAVRGLGKQTSQGSGLVCQAIVGGAVIQQLQAFAADISSIQLSFLVPMICYIYIGWYALRGADKD
jgi:FHS family L-fucose permease-like MFS transporter